MRSRFLLPLLSIVLLLGLLTTGSQDGIAVPSGGTNPGTVILPGAGTTNNIAHTVSEKRDPAPVFYRVGRQQQIPVTVNERYPGYAHLPRFSLAWKAGVLHHDIPVKEEANIIFLDRIRILLYPKHSFW